jgi:hypothetical protein
MPTIYYQNCTCPHCKVKLDTLAESAPICPTCNKPLNPRDVWATRKYPGLLILPRWLTAFGWPLLLILAGVLCIALAYAARIPIPLKIPAILIAIGLVYFFIKLSGVDD